MLTTNATRSTWTAVDALNLDGLWTEPNRPRGVASGDPAPTGISLDPILLDLESSC